MDSNQPELRAATVTVLLGTLALTLAIIVGYAWWSAQRGLTRHAEEKTDIIARLFGESMTILPDCDTDQERLNALTNEISEMYGVSRLEIARGAAVARQHGPLETSYVPDNQAQQAFQTGRGATVIVTRNGQRYIRRLKVLAASKACLGCHDVEQGEILGIMDVSFDLERVQPSSAGFYRNLGLVSALVAVIAVLLVLLIFSRIHVTHRLEGIAALASAIAAGDLERRVSRLPGAEMDSLARAINEMAHSLQTHNAALTRQQNELEEANRRLQVLMQEAHHRIKNNLQTVADLLFLEASRCPSGLGKCLHDSIQRVKSIATVHELLSVEQAESTDVRLLAERLLEIAIRNLALPGRRITGVVDGDRLLLSSKQATSLALVMNELINNALMHGLEDKQTGQVTVNVQPQNGLAAITVQDDGAGLPAGFAWDSHQQLGLRIVRTLVKRELGGEFAFQDGGGTIAMITIPFEEQDGTIKNPHR